MGVRPPQPDSSSPPWMAALDGGEGGVCPTPKESKGAIPARPQSGGVLATSQETMTVEASLSHQEEDIVYYDAKADAELVSAPTLAEGRRGASRATPPPLRPVAWAGRRVLGLSILSLALQGCDPTAPHPIPPTTP